MGAEPACFYMLHTGHPRVSEISECDKYETGQIKMVSTLGGFEYEDCDI